MTKYLKLIIVSVTLVALIGGAAFLYNNLDKSSGNSLVINSEWLTSAPTQSEDTSAVATEGASIESDNSTSENLTTDAHTDPISGVHTEDIVHEIMHTMSDKHNFTMIDKDGNTLKLSDLTGKPIVLNFWATWCPYCVQELPDFEELYKKYGDRVNFAVVNVTDGSETVEKAKKFIAEKGYTFPIYFDTMQDGAQKYGTDYGIPMSFFFDEMGNLVAFAEGAISASAIEEGIGMILK